MPLSLLRPIDNWRAPPPKPGRVEWLGQWTYAHRGLHGQGVPENSPAAFAAAIGRGFGIECDIQRSSDGQPMVFHDWDLDRLTGESGAVADRTAESLGRITLSESENCIPTLRQLLDLIDERVPVLVEIKSRESMRIAEVCLAVRRAFEGYRGAAAVMSFDPRVSRWFAGHAPHIVRGLVVTEDGRRTLTGHARRRLSLWHAKPDFLAYDIRDLPSRFAASQRKRGLPVLTWTVRSSDLRARAAEHADAPIAEGTGIEPPA